MKNRLLFTTTVLLLIVVSFFFIKNNKTKSNIDSIRAQHKLALENSPFNTTKNLSKEDRLSMGLPPNAYNERMWELTMDPQTGRPMPERLYALQSELKLQRLAKRGVGGDANNAWVERGPNNQGGRTRAIMYDPNDGTNKRVFAGGVSGGLWVNNDITNANSSWTEVNLPQNLSVSSIVYDPNNTMTFYVGTGESYVGGAVNGNGLWKSVDAGVSWERIFGGATANGEGAKVTVNSPGSIAGDYVAIQAAFGAPLTSITGNLVLVNDGTASPSEGCNALTNGSAISGNIAVIERGSCTFASKVKNAENAGAIAVLVINNVTGSPIIMGGGDYTIYIPAIMISQTDGQTIMAELGNTVNVTIQPDVTPSSGSFSSGGIQHINDIAIRDVGSTSEIYVAAAASLFADANPIGFLGTGAYGLYKSTDNGTTWTLLTLPNNGNSALAPNDIEIGPDNKVWVSTTRSLVAPADPGGQVLSSSDGTTFTLKHTITNGRRTQIAVSASNANKVYVLAQLTSGTNGVEIIRTDDGFTTQTSLTLPNDVDTGISATDFTRDQSFYDLMLEVDPTNDNIVYVGGIDIFRSSNSGTSWSQLSKWSNNNNLGSLNVPLVHADQHAFVFDPSDATKAVIGNDGGVFYATSLSGTQVINSRNKDYNTVQFYNGTIDPVDGANGDDLIGGTQDNGTQFVQDATVGINGFFDPVGGDGGYTEIDNGGTYMIQSYPRNNHRFISYSGLSTRYYITATKDGLSTDGSFINEAVLDTNLDIFYSNSSTSTPTFSIERTSNFVAGAGGIVNIPLTNTLLNASQTAFKVSPFTAGSTKLFVGLENGKLLRVDNADGSDTWTNITGASFIGSISDIEFGETELDIFVTMHNYGVISIWFTSNGGSTWISIEGDLPDIPVKCILQNTLIPNELIIGTDLGVWSTANYTVASPVWVQSFNGMKDTKVVDLDVRTSDNVILATTFGRGFFTSQFTLTPLGLDDNNFANNSIRVFPTVSNGEFSILSKNSLGKVEMSLFTITGQKVYTTTFELTNIKKSFNLSLSSGLYLIKIKGDNFEETKRVIIK